MFLGFLNLLYTIAVINCTLLNGRKNERCTGKELGRIWKEAIVVYFSKYCKPYHNFLRGTEENHTSLSRDSQSPVPRNKLETWEAYIPP
jgi:hypothetical protein